MGKPVCWFLLIGGLCLPVVSVSQTAPYQGKPFHDSTYRGGPQSIPGKVFCAYYDLGGEGVAYHDSDAKNSGSGGLNPADGTYLNQFRMDESVDTSYIKFHDQIDNNPYNLVKPLEDLMYVGWTVPGEWFNLTVSVARAGSYTTDLFYTSNRGGEISFDLDGKKLTGPVHVSTTNDAAEPIDWRQWHHWNLMKNLVQVDLPEGVHVLTFHIVSEGNMNFAYLDFKPTK